MAAYSPAFPRARSAAAPARKGRSTEIGTPHTRSIGSSKNFRRTPRIHPVRGGSHHGNSTRAPYSYGSYASEPGDCRFLLYWGSPRRAMASVTRPAVSVQPVAAVAEVARSVMGDSSGLVGAPTEWRQPQVPRARLVALPPISDDAAERDSTVAVAVRRGGRLRRHRVLGCGRRFVRGLFVDSLGAPLDALFPPIQQDA